MSGRRMFVVISLVSASVVGSLLALPTSVNAAPPRQGAGKVVEVTIPEAVGGKVVIGNLAVDEQGGDGFVTGYPCDQPRPLRSDLNAVAGPPQSNRFIGATDPNGRLCFASNVAAHMIFDAHAVLANAIAIPHRRTDTRNSGGPPVPAGGVLE